MVNNKKIGLGIVCFEGTEHLESIISEIREYVDIVVLHMQTISYCGNTIDKVDLDEINRLKNIGLIDYILEFNNIDGMPFREQETIKRNNTIEFLQNKGCDYVHIIDSDEFYDKTEFKNAADFIINNNIEISYCRYINYYHDLKHYIVMPFKCYVPFLLKSKYRFKFNCNDFSGASDPTRRVSKPNNVDNFVFDWNFIKMHHMSWLRNDIRKKINNWSAKTHFDNDLIDKAVESFKKWDGGVKTTILFNVPNNQVNINELPTQYAYPKNTINYKYE